MKIISFMIARDQEESNKNHRSRDRSHHGQEAGAAPHQGAGGGGGDEPEEYYTSWIAEELTFSVFSVTGLENCWVVFFSVKIISQ